MFLADILSDEFKTKISTLASRRARDQHESKEEEMTSNGEGDPKSDEETDKDDSQDLEKSV
jgi:hypothetical protein